MKLVDLKQCQGHTPPHHFDMRTFPLVPKQAGQGRPGDEPLLLSARAAAPNSALSR